MCVPWLLVSLIPSSLVSPTLLGNLASEVRAPSLLSLCSPFRRTLALFLWYLRFSVFPPFHSFCLFIARLRSKKRFGCTMASKKVTRSIARPANSAQARADALEAETKRMEERLAALRSQMAAAQQEFQSIPRTKEGTVWKSARPVEGDYAGHVMQRVQARAAALKTAPKASAPAPAPAPKRAAPAPPAPAAAKATARAPSARANAKTTPSVSASASAAASTSASPAPAPVPVPADAAGASTVQSQPRARYVPPVPGPAAPAPAPRPPSASSNTRALDRKSVV